jgi:hypothetical protein
MATPAMITATSVMCRWRAVTIGPPRGGALHPAQRLLPRERRCAARSRR